MVCEDLDKFRTYGFKGLAAVVGGDDREREVPANLESHQCYKELHRIGEALTKRVPKKWNAAEQLVELYGSLATKLSKTKYRPLRASDLPRCLDKLKNRACDLSKKLKKSGKLSFEEQKLAARLARKTVPVMLAVATFIGLEQDFGGFTRDMESAVTFLLHGVSELAINDALEVSLPERELPLG